MAANPSTPPETLKVLAGDKDWDVRLPVAENPNTPQEALKILAGDADVAVRLSVTRHPACPSEELDRLAREGGFVSTAAREQLKQREQRRREAACEDYADELKAGSIGYGGEL